ncbi:MAG: DMT family transporter [Mogibacterium sp.]|nr:DMT family transporter [Mogibacterium sp.]
MNERRGEILVGTALALRGSSLLFAKIGMRTMGPFLLMGCRNLIAFAIIALLFRKQLVGVTKRELAHSALLGFALFLSMAFELKGLQTTTSTVTAFLEGTAVVMVPIITCILTRRLPSRMTIICSLIALFGVGFLTLKGDRVGFSSGEILVLIGAFWYSTSVIITDYAAKKDDPMHVAVYQLLFISIFSLIGAFFVEEIRLPASSTEWGAILALAIICSGVGFTIQPLGQKYTTPERAGLLTVANPLSAALLGIVFLHEKMTAGIVAGAILIIISIVYPYIVQVFASSHTKKSSGPAE